MNNVNLQPGQSLLVHGGASGIGTTAIQLAKALGSRVFATAGSQDKIDACLSLGAEFAFNYKTENFVEKVLEKTGGEGVNVVLDMVGGTYTNNNLKVLASKGTLSQIAFLNGPEVTIDLRLIMQKRLHVTGSTLRPRTNAEKAEIATHLKHRVWPLFEYGTLKPVIFKVFPISQAAEAHELLEEGNHIGKIVLTTDFYVDHP
jgi:NADPH:quinone reductase-like Zn-dependent oxidoreductase